MTKTSMIPPTIDLATVDHYVAKGRRARSQAFVSLIRAIFSQPQAAPKTARTARTARTA